MYTPMKFESYQPCCHRDGIFQRLLLWAGRRPSRPKEKPKEGRRRSHPYGSRRAPRTCLSNNGKGGKEGIGRLYVVTITATDSCGNPTEAFHQIRIVKELPKKVSKGLEI
jgi:hypothetical protein